MKVRWSAPLVLGVILVTNGMSMRFVADRLTTVYHRMAIEKREIIASKSSLFVSDEDRKTAVKALFEVEKTIALSTYRQNLMVVANIIIFIGIVLSIVGVNPYVLEGQRSPIRSPTSKTQPTNGR